MTTPVDPGLQPERTELAWRRTALGIGVGSLIALRMLPDATGNPWWVFVGVAGVLIAVAIWIFGRRRLGGVRERMARDGLHARMPGAGPLAALVGLVLVTGVLGMVLVALIALAPA